MYVCTRTCVCAVCRNQWKRVEEAAWQERTVGVEDEAVKSDGWRAGGSRSVGRVVGVGG